MNDGQCPTQHTVNPGYCRDLHNVADVDRARDFYQSLFGFEMMESDRRFCVFPVGKDVLLLFARGGTERPTKVPGGVIPPHDTQGAGHLAFAISHDTIDPRRARLRERGIKIESEVHWEHGGASLYFRDLDDNLLELVTPGTWQNY